MKSFLLFSAIILLAIYQGFSQEIQWAEKTVFQINQFSDTEYSTQQALGKPDAEPYGHQSTKAFQLNSESAYGTMTLEYAEPQYVSQVLIVENYKPGNVNKVILYDTDEKAYEIYSSKGTDIFEPFNILKVNIEKTEYLVKK